MSEGTNGRRENTCLSHTVYPSCLINKVTLMQYMTYRVAWCLRYEGFVERRDFKGSPLGFLQIFNMPGDITITVPRHSKMAAESRRVKYLQFIFTEKHRVVFF